MIALALFRQFVSQTCGRISRKRSSRRSLRCRTYAAEIETLESKHLLATFAQIVAAIDAQFQTALTAHNLDTSIRISSLASANVSTSNEILSLISTAPASADASFGAVLDAKYNSVRTNTSGLVTTWAAGMTASGSLNASGFLGPMTMMPGYDFYYGANGSIFITPFSWNANINKTITGTTASGDLISDVFKYDGNSFGAGKIEYTHDVHDPANITRTAWSGNYDIQTQEYQFSFSKKDPTLNFYVNARGTPTSLMMASGNIDITPGTGSYFHFDFSETATLGTLFNGSIEQLVGTSDGGSVKIVLGATRNLDGVYGTAGASYLNGGNSIAVIYAHNNPFNGPAFSGVTTTYSLDTLIPGLKVNGSTGIDYDLTTGIRTPRVHQSFSTSYQLDTQHWKVLINAGVNQMGTNMWMYDFSAPNYGKDTFSSKVWVEIYPR